MAFRYRRACMLFAGAGMLVSCDSTIPETRLQIRLVNSTAMTIDVSVSVTGVSSTNRTLAPDATLTVLQPGGDGDSVDFSVNGPSGSGANGWGRCTAGPDMVGTGSGVHGQVNFFMADATTIEVECSGAGLAGGGWR